MLENSTKWISHYENSIIINIGDSVMARSPLQYFLMCYISYAYPPFNALSIILSKIFFGSTFQHLSANRCCLKQTQALSTRNWLNSMQDHCNKKILAISRNVLSIQRIVSTYRKFINKHFINMVLFYLPFSIFIIPTSAL